MSIRKLLEEQEKKNLSPYATFSTETEGRQKEDEECNIRLAFQTDRDRIIHSKAFRRLKHKTQVFLSPSGDHYRTRLTHTLEVAQIARTISRSLRLNEDLTEAIALGHDLGHTPFGHSGEAVLNSVYSKGFRHPEQSLRVVDVLEKGGKGLNLTYEVRDGILKHSKGASRVFSSKKEDNPCTVEGQIVRISDRIAYIAHDIDDALRSGVLTFANLPKPEIALLGDRHSQRINKMVHEVISSTSRTLPDVSMTEDTFEAMENMKKFLYKNLYYNDVTHNEFIKVSKILKDIFEYYVDKPEDLLEEFRKNFLYSPNQKDAKTRNKAGSQEEKERIVCDFVAGMTDRYALKTYEEIFFPKPWLVI